jgi:hypothetical protein
MENRIHRALGILLGVALVSIVNVDIANAQGAQPTATAGTAGRVGKFVNNTDLGNSVLFETGGRIGLGTTEPLSALDVRGSVNLWAALPYLIFRDTTTGNLRSYIRSSNGGLGFFGEDYVNASNASAFVQIDRDGRLGIGTSTPQRTIQIGADTNALFTMEPSPGSPLAGAIRFGDNTGWALMIGRNRDSAGAPLNNGFQGGLVAIWDDGKFQLLRLPLGSTGTRPLCLANTTNVVTPCQSSSLRYKKDVEPYYGGLDVISRFRPIAFTRIHNGSHDIGLAAEDVAEIDPRLTYSNETGEVEGVRYELLTTLLINAVNEQREQIEELKSAVARLEAAQP